MEMEHLYHFGETVIYVLIAFVFLIIIKKTIDYLVHKEYQADYEIEENSNIAIAVRRAGLYLGFSIGFAGSLTGESTGIAIDAYLLQAVDLGLITLFMFISFYISDKLLIPGINNTQAIMQQNIAVASSEAGLFIATGIIAAASFSGEGSFISSIIFFTLGQVVLLLMSFIYEYMNKYSLKSELKKANTSAGVMLGGMLIAISLILNASISGPSNELILDIIAFAYSAVMGIVLIIIFFSKSMDKFFFSNTNIEKEIEEDQNLAAIIITVSIKIALAFIIASVLI